jgi:hypothetical protein
LVVNRLYQGLELVVESIEVSFILILVGKWKGSDKELKVVLLSEECEAKENPVIHHESQMVLFHDLYSNGFSVPISGAHDGNQHIEQVEDNEEISKEVKSFEPFLLFSISEVNESLGAAPNVNCTPYQNADLIKK